MSVISKAPRVPLSKIIAAQSMKYALLDVNYTLIPNSALPALTAKRCNDSKARYAAVCGMDWAGSVTVLAKRPRDAAKIEGIEEKLAHLYADLKRGA